MTVTDRPTWETLPQFVRDAVEERLGTVVKSECVHSRRPGLAARIYATEEDAFLKAVPLKFGDHILEPFRRECQAASFLPWPGAPAPWLAWRREVGDWLILAFELINDRARYVNLRPDDQDVPIVVGAVERLSWQPCREGWEGIIPSAREHVHALMDTARSLLDQLPALTDPQLYSRAVDRLSVDRLATGVPTLVHGDLCRKNILYKESCAYLIDWSQAFTGPGWMGLADLAPLLISEGHSPQEADRLLRGSSPLWEKAHADDVAGLAALMSLRHWARAGQQVDRDAQVLAEAGQKWLRYRMDAVTSRP